MARQPACVFFKEEKLPLSLAWLLGQCEKSEVHLGARLLLRILPEILGAKKQMDQKRDPRRGLSFQREMVQISTRKLPKRVRMILECPCSLYNPNVRMGFMQNDQRFILEIIGFQQCPCEQCELNPSVIPPLWLVNGDSSVGLFLYWFRIPPLLLLLYWIIIIPIKQPIEVSNTIGYMIMIYQWKILFYPWIPSGKST